MVEERRRGTILDARTSREVVKWALRKNTGREYTGEGNTRNTKKVADKEKKVR